MSIRGPRHLHIVTDEIADVEPPFGRERQAEHNRRYAPCPATGRVHVYQAFGLVSKCKNCGVPETEDDARRSEQHD